MGSVFRRSYKDRRTGRAKRVRTYTIKYRDAAGRWVTEATDTAQKHVPQRILLEREAGIRGPAPRPDAAGAGPGGGDPEELTLEALRDRYLASASLRLKPRTLAMYAERLGFTLRGLGVRSPAELTTDLIDAYVRRRLAGGTAPRTANIEVSVLRRMLAWAVDGQLLAEDPLTRWKPVRDPRTRRRRALTDDEVKRLLGAAPPWRRILWMTLAATGMRRGEAIELLTTDFDARKGVIRLRPEITKSARGRRCPLPAGLTRLLTEYVESERRTRAARQRDYLGRVRAKLARLEGEGQ
jgi:integrase